MKKNYDGFNFVTALSLKNTKGSHTVGKENDYSANFYGLKPGEGINFPKLINFFKVSGQGALTYWRFRGPAFKERKAVSRYGVVETGKVLNKTIPFTYTNEYKQVIETSINCGINKKEGFVQGSTPHFSLNVDYKTKTIDCRLSYFYTGTEKYRRAVNDTASKEDFSLLEKNVAVKFFSENMADMAFLTEKVYGRSDWYKDLINKTYLPLLENAKTAEELIWLYENAADFTLAVMKPEILWKHIGIFYGYDTEGTFSFIKDASLPLMKTLFAFNTEEKIKYLMQQFHKDQAFIKKIYDALDGTMLYEGKEQKRQTIFASIITSFCFADTSTLNFMDEVFYVGKDYYVNVEDVKNDDKEQSKYWVEQYYKSEVYYPGVTESITLESLESKIKMNPLDIVTLLQKDTDSLLFVPVLFLRDIDHQKDIQKLLTTIRIGVDILAIGLTVATLGGTSPLLAVAGALEITIAAIDIVVMANKDMFSKEFLETWEKIYIIGGIATASPFVVSSLYKLGGKILASSAKAEMKNFVISCMVKLMLEREISNLSRNLVKVLKTNTELVEATKGALTEFKAKTLNKYGILIIEGEFKTGKTVTKEAALVYKGEIIRHADRYDFFNKTYPLLKNINNEKEFIKLADELLVYGKEYPVNALKPLITEAQAYSQFGNAGKTLVKSVDDEIKYVLQNFDDKIIEQKVMVSGMIYNKSLTGKYYTATNFLKEEIAKGKGKVYLDFLEELHPTLKARLEKHVAKLKLEGVLATKEDILRAGKAGSHGEIRALDKLLKEVDPQGKLGEFVFQDIIGYNRFLRYGAVEIQPPCVHCFYLTSGVKFIGF